MSADDGSVGIRGGSAAHAAEKKDRPAVGQKAPDFELKSIDGENLRLSKLLDDGPVVLLVLRGYPGYQCPVCTAQVGGFLSNADKFAARNARIVAVYPGPAIELKKHAQDFVRGKTLPANFYLVLDPDYQLTSAYGLRWDAPRETAYPSTFVIDRDRMVRFAKISNSHGDRASAQETLQALPAK